MLKTISDPLLILPPVLSEMKPKNLGAREGNQKGRSVVSEVSNHVKLRLHHGDRSWIPRNVRTYPYGTGRVGSRNI